MAPQASTSNEPPRDDGPRMWRHAVDAWRLSSRLSPRNINLFLRVRSARALPRSFRARFAAMRIPGETLNDVLSKIRSLDDWMEAWNHAAQQFLGEARREESAGHWHEAAVARRNAAMSYHAAYFVTDTDPRTVRTLKASGVNAFAQAISRLMPEAKRIDIPWRTSKLPAYLAKPQGATGPLPLVVMLNGATTTKEEMLLWADEFLEQQIAVLALDWPGTGEAGLDHPMIANCDDITVGIRGLATSDPCLDPARVVLCGFSLGGALGIRSLILDRAIAAGIAVTPPYEPRAWLPYVNPVVGQQLLTLLGEASLSDQIVESFSLADLMPRLRTPLLIFGAGRDLVVPPEESLHLAGAAAELGTLVWYPRGSHGLYEHVDDWTHVAATWITALFSARAGAPSTRVDDADTTASPA